MALRREKGWETGVDNDGRTSGNSHKRDFGVTSDDVLPLAPLSSHAAHIRRSCALYVCKILRYYYSSVDVFTYMHCDASTYVCTHEDHLLVL